MPAALWFAEQKKKRRCGTLSRSFHAHFLRTVPTPLLILTGHVCGDKAGGARIDDELGVFARQVNRVGVRAGF